MQGLTIAGARVQGFMTDYYIAGPEECGVEEREGAPAVLLVHGFGAFGEQWRGQLRPLARAGYRVRVPINLSMRTLTIFVPFFDSYGPLAFCLILRARMCVCARARVCVVLKPIQKHCLQGKGLAVDPYV